MRTQERNQMQWLAMSQGLCRKEKLWTIPGREELEGLDLDRWAGERRGVVCSDFSMPSTRGLDH
jgi:hypothetical protein